MRRSEELIKKIQQIKRLLSEVKLDLQEVIKDKINCKKEVVEEVVEETQPKPETKEETEAGRRAEKANSRVDLKIPGKRKINILAEVENPWSFLLKNE